MNNFLSAKSENRVIRSSGRFVMYENKDLEVSWSADLNTKFDLTVRVTKDDKDKNFFFRWNPLDGKDGLLFEIVNPNTLGSTIDPINIGDINGKKIYLEVVVQKIGALYAVDLVISE